MQVQLSTQEIALLKVEFDRAELTAREFFFRKVVGEFLDEKLQHETVRRSLEGIFPAMTKQEIRDLLNQLEDDRVGLNGLREYYMDNLWANFTISGKNIRH